MTGSLFAWEGDILVGRFEKRGVLTAFSYEPHVAFPISLSPPLDGSWHEDALAPTP